MATHQPSPAPAGEPQGPKRELPKKGHFSGITTAIALTAAAVSGAACGAPPAPVCLTPEKQNEDPVKATFKKWEFVSDNLLRITFVVSKESVTDPTCQLPYYVQAVGTVDGHESAISDPFPFTEAGLQAIDAITNPGGGKPVSSLRLRVGHDINGRTTYSNSLPFQGGNGSSTTEGPTASQEQP